MYFVGVDAHIDPRHFELGKTGIKNLRVIFLAQQTLGAKILRLPPVAQDDRSSSGSRYSATLPKREGLGTDSSTTLRYAQNDILFGDAAGNAFCGSMWASTPTRLNVILYREFYVCFAGQSTFVKITD